MTEGQIPHCAIFSCLRRKMTILREVWPYLRSWFQNCGPTSDWDTGSGTTCDKIWKKLEIRDGEKDTDDFLP